MVFRKGDIPWNKGLTKEKSKLIKKMSHKTGKTRKRLFSEGKIKPNKGMLGKNPWNKGLKKENDERVRKNCENSSRTLRKLYANGKVISHMLGKHHSEKTKEKISKRKKKMFKEGKLKFWNKGLTKETDERIKAVAEKNSKLLKNRYILGYLPKNIGGRKEDNPMYGKEFSEEHRIKISTGVRRHIKKHPEFLEKLKEVRAKTILPIKDSSIELKIQDFLTTLKIEFFIHKHMNIKHSYQCDIFIPSKNLIIECDGDFIHCNPKKYSPEFVRFPKGKKIMNAQEIWKIDNFRTKELLEKGYNVWRIWENEIRKMKSEDFENKLTSIKC